MDSGITNRRRLLYGSLPMGMMPFSALNIRRTVHVEHPNTFAASLILYFFSFSVSDFPVALQQHPAASPSSRRIAVPILLASSYNFSLESPNKLAGKLPIRLRGLVHVAHSRPRFMLLAAAAKLLDNFQAPHIRNLSINLEDQSRLSRPINANRRWCGSESSC